jgi:hypothetical protein
MSERKLLNTTQMAQFVARGFLRFDGVVPAELNQAFLDDIGQASDPGRKSVRESGRKSGSKNDPPNLQELYRQIMTSSSIPVVAAGTALGKTYPAASPLGRILALPVLSGAIRSLVGEHCVFDHHFLHIAFPRSLQGKPPRSQNTHQDSTIDPRRAFDIQILYFPHAVTATMGGTRFIPGTHLRIVSEAAIARYQNMLGQQHVVCPSGTVLILHHGLWHGGGANRSKRLRYMFKIRLCPSAPQVRLWDTGDLEDEPAQRPIFWLDGPRDPASVATILTTPEPWQEADTGRLEYLNRIRLWRYLIDDESFDADYWLTRVENEPV